MLKTLVAGDRLRRARKAGRLIPLPAGIRVKTTREVEASAMRQLDARAKARQKPALRVVKGD